MINLASIPASIRTPGSTIAFDASKASSGTVSTPPKILVIGQRLAAATVATLVPTLISSADQAKQAFGRGSMLAQMVSAIGKVNGSSQIWAVALDDLGAGVAATQTVTLTGPATASGTLALRIADVAVPVVVTAGDTATAIATAIVTAVTANPDLPVTAASAAGVVTLTAKHKGVCGNDIDVRANYFQGEQLPAGLTLAIAPATVGAGNPDLTPLWAVLGDVQYQGFVTPYTDAANLTSIETELLSRWGPDRQIEGVAFAALRGTLGAVAAIGTARNCPLMSILAMKGALAPTWAIAAAYAGQVVLEGAIDPARPFTTLALTGISAPAVADQWTKAERNTLLYDGLSTATVDSGGVVRIERAITTYQKNSYGLPDVAYLDVNTPLTLGYFRASLRQRIANLWPRHKLADDGTAYGAGQAIVTPSAIAAEIIALAGEWEEAGLLEDMTGFKAGLIVERDANDRNRVNALLPPNLVNQFLVFAGSVQFRL